MGWDELLALVQEQHQERQGQAKVSAGQAGQPPIACPYDGTPLEVVSAPSQAGTLAGRTGAFVPGAPLGRMSAQRHCRYCGYTYPS